MLSFRILLYLQSCYLGLESKYTGDCLHVDYHFDSCLKNKGASPKNKSETKSRTSLYLSSCFSGPCRHSWSHLALWIQTQISKSVETKHCLNSPCIIWGAAELFYLTETGKRILSHFGVSQYTMGTIQNMQPKKDEMSLVAQRGLNDGGSDGSPILRADSRCPKSWWKLLHIHPLNTAEAQGTCSSVARERSRAGASEAGWMPAGSPSARGILSWENWAAFQPCCSEYISIYLSIYMYSRTFKGIIIFPMSSSLTEIFISYLV